MAAVTTSTRRFSLASVRLLSEPSFRGKDSGEGLRRREHIVVTTGLEGCLKELSDTLAKEVDQPGGHS